MYHSFRQEIQKLTEICSLERMESQLNDLSHRQ